MLDFQLLRIKVIYPLQKQLFTEPPSRTQLLRQIIETRPHPKCEIRKGSVWLIGNVEPVGTEGLYFRLGRIGHSKYPLLEGEDFVDTVLERYPNTHVLIDTAEETCVIAKSSSLQTKPANVGLRLAELLRASPLAQEHNADIEVNAVIDPTDFIDHLRGAAVVTRFWMTFSRPNHGNVDEFILKPLQRWTEVTNAKNGKVDVTGDGLDPDALVDVSRSLAATGENAGARLQRPGELRPRRLTLRGKSVMLAAEEPEVNTDDGRKGFLSRIREMLSRISHG